MTNRHGDYIWYELLTTDIKAAQTFYGPLLGWQFTDSGQPDEYIIASAKDNQVAGMMQIPPDTPMPPCWMGYIAVDDVDGMVKAITAEGGSVHIDPWTIENVGRLAFVADPQGAMFYIMQQSDNMKKQGSLAFSTEVPIKGHCGWNELMTNDQQAAVAFYQKQFNWSKDEPMDMGEAGIYDLLRHGTLIAGVMTQPTAMPVSQWIYYFRVDDIDMAVEAIKDLGGKIVADPMEIPGGDYMIQGLDPQNTLFSLFGPRTS